MGEDRDWDAPPDGQALGGDDRLMEEIRSTFVVPIEARVAAGHIADAISAMPGEPPRAAEGAVGSRIRRRLASMTVFSGLTAKVLTGAVALAAVGGTVASANGIGISDIADAIGFGTERAVVVPFESTTTTSPDDSHAIEAEREAPTIDDGASEPSGEEDARDLVPDGSPIPDDPDDVIDDGDDGDPGDIVGDGGGRGDRPGEEDDDGGDEIPLPDPSP